MNSSRKKNYSRLFHTGTVSVLAILSLTFMSGCLDDDDGDIHAIPVAYVSLYQASPDAPGLNITVDGRVINSSSFDYKDHTGYLRFYTGERNIKIGPFGANNVAIDTTVTLDENKTYSIFVVNDYQQAEILFLKDSANAPAEGKARLRFVNLSPDSENSEVQVTGETNALFEDHSFKEASEFIEVDAKEYDFEIGTNGDNTLNVPDINLKSGYYYTIVLRGYQNSESPDKALSAEVLVN